VALVTTSALASKPTTGSLKTMLTGIGECCVGSDAVDAIATVGAVRSVVTVACAPSPTVCVTPPIVTVTVPLRTEKRIWSARFVPWVMLTSADSPGSSSNEPTGNSFPSSSICRSVTRIGAVLSGEAVTGLPVDAV
jgi:hypothetical protein